MVDPNVEADWIRWVIGGVITGGMAMAGLFARVLSSLSRRVTDLEKTSGSVEALREQLNRYHAENRQELMRLRDSSHQNGQKLQWLVGLLGERLPREDRYTTGD